MDNQPKFGARLFRAFRNLLLFSLVLAAAGAAIYALSLLNSRTYSLEIRGGQLVVMKGRMMPTGAEPWLPSDPTLADTYAPIDLEGNTSLSVLNQKFQERDELDRALFTVLSMLASPRVASDAPKDWEKALVYVRRAERLTGLTEDQRAALKKMQVDLAFYLARIRLDDARRQLEEALAQLKLAAESDSRHKDDANLMLMAVEPQVRLLSGTLRATAQTDMKTLSKALEPTLQSMFEALKQKFPQELTPTPGPTAEPKPAEPAPAPETPKAPEPPSPVPGPAPSRQPTPP
ncbi:MAG: IF-2 protein [Myxococcota bacterium]